jgi:hypothetical protein
MRNHTHLRIRINAERFKAKLDIKDGKDAVVDYDLLKHYIVGEVSARLPQTITHEGTTIKIENNITYKEVMSMIKSAPKGEKINYADIEDAPDYQAILARIADAAKPQSVARTAFLSELDDLDLSTLASGQFLQWNGKKWIGMTAGGASVWGHITGNLSDQTDLATALAARLPAGTDGATQFNQGGNFGGDTSFLFSDYANKFQGVQNTSPEAPLHAKGVYGKTVPNVPSLSYTFTVDTPVTSPMTAAATQVYPPTPATPTGLSFNYIDQTQWSGGSPNINQNTSPSSPNHYFNGQTIYITVNEYRNVGGTLVINPSGQSTSWTDYSYSGNPFSIQIDTFTTNNGYTDGRIVTIYDTYTGLTTIVDIGSATSYDDDGASGQVSFQTSQYPSNGGTWTTYFGQYKNLAGTLYRDAFVANSNSDANVSGAYMIFTSTVNPAVNDGFIFGASGYVDIGTATSYTEWGQYLGGDPSNVFSSYAFPNFNTSLTNSSAGGGLSWNYGGGTITADGGSYYYEVWEYRNHPLTGARYFIGSPSTSGSISDDNSSNYIQFSDTLSSTGDGDGRVILLYKNSSLVGGVDIGSGNSFSGLEGNTPPAITPAISSYTGILRNFADYGYISSPFVKFSGTPATYSFTDDNTAPYMIAHTQSSFGNATGIKIIETSYRGVGYVIVNSTVSVAYQTNNGMGDNNTSPQTLGYPSAGQTVAYNAYAKETINGGVVYSLVPKNLSVVFPNDGLYRAVNITIGSVAGATYRVQKVSVGWHDFNSTTFTDDNTSVSWTGSSTTTPNYSNVPAMISERAMSSISDVAIHKFRNSNNGLYGMVDFEYTNGGGVFNKAASFGVNTSGNFVIDSYNSGLEIGVIGSPHTRFQPTQTVFNLRNGSYEWLFKGTSTAYLMAMYAGYDTVFMGTNAFSYGDPNATLAVFTGGSDVALTLASNGSSTSLLATYKDTSGVTRWTLDRGGRMGIARNGSGNANLYVGAGDNTYTQIQLENTATLPSSPVAGGFERYDNQSALYWTDKNSVRRTVLLSPTSYVGFQWAYIDSNGNIATDNKIYWNGSYVQASTLWLFQQGLSISAGQSLGVGSAFTIIGNSLAVLQSNNSSGTLLGNTTTQKWGIWNATPIARPANTIAIDTFLTNFGFRPSGGVANFDTDIKAAVLGKGFYVKEGTNATMGVATLSAGSVVVSTTKVTANSRIFLTTQGGTLTNVSDHYISARTAGTSFTITSLNILDASTVGWLIVEPA